MGKIKPKRLGEILLDAGIVSKEQLERALLEQKKWGYCLGRTFVELGVVSESMVVECLVSQLKLERVDLKNRAIPEKTIQLLPIEFLKRHHLVPFADDRESIHVAISEPLDVGVEHQIQKHSHLRPKFYLAMDTELRAVLERITSLSIDPLEILPYQNLKEEMEAIISDFISTKQRGIIAKDLSHIVGWAQEMNRSDSLTEGYLEVEGEIYRWLELLITKNIVKPDVRQLLAISRITPKGGSPRVTDQMTHIKTILKGVMDWCAREKLVTHEDIQKVVHCQPEKGS